MTDARGPVAVLVAALVAVALLGLHSSLARARRQRDQPAIDAVVGRLPSGDLALSGGARWLRHLSTEEPSAAFADGPGVPDPDPAGGIVAPPEAAEERP